MPRHLAKIALGSAARMVRLMAQQMATINQGPFWAEGEKHKSVKFQQGIG